MSEIKLSPPWFTLRNELFYTIGQTPGVIVSEVLPTPDGNYEIRIEVTDRTKRAIALRGILPASFDFGGVIVKIRVYICEAELVPFDPTPATAAELAEIFCTALKCNPLFAGIVLTEGLVPPMQQAEIGDVVLVIFPEVIQFYNDDISDLCSNFNGIAADVFLQVIKTTINDFKIGSTTFATNCDLCEKMVCKRK